MLERKIDRAIEKETMKTGKMGTEPVTVEMALDMCAYAPATVETPGTVYTVHKDYTISKGKRRFNDVRVKYLDRGMKVITDCDNLNNPCFFI